MTNEELAARVAFDRRCFDDDGCGTCEPIVMLAAQRDRALALLRDERDGCGVTFSDECNASPSARRPCWEHRRRALLAEVGS